MHGIFPTAPELRHILIVPPPLLRVLHRTRRDLEPALEPIELLHLALAQLEIEDLGVVRDSRWRR